MSAEAPEKPAAVTPNPPSAVATNPPVEERITARSRMAVGHAIGGDDGTDLAGGPWLPYIYDTKLIASYTYTV